MSKLNELIKELCPDGVEYKKLNEISEMKRGTSVTKKDIIEGDIPVISGGREPAYYCDTFNRDGETITVAGSGAGAGYVQYWTVPIFVCDAFSIKGKDCVKTKYLYYYLSNMQEYIYSTKKGGGVPHVHISSIDNMKIPIPPLPVQCEIVRILDNFTALTSALTAELTAQRKQYEYYRDAFLTFAGGQTDSSVRWLKLGDIGHVSMCRRILKSETSISEKVPFYKIGTFGKNADTFISISKYEEYRKKYPFPKKGDVLISAAGTIGRTVIYDGSPSYYQDSNIVWLSHDESIVTNKFLYYCYQLNPWKVSNGGTISRLYNDNINKAEIPIPSLEEQQRIVDILDRFDKLCNDLSEGLPAEIAARQKQYEYYRDKLLTFNEKEA